jgi:hypothetical protein
MKGYLCRMAAAVIRPQAALHPFVESIYPGSRPETPVQPPAKENMGFTNQPPRAESQEPSHEPPSEKFQALVPPRAHVPEHNESDWAAVLPLEPALRPSPFASPVEPPQIRAQPDDIATRPQPSQAEPLVALPASADPSSTQTQFYIERRFQLVSESSPPSRTPPITARRGKPAPSAAPHSPQPRADEIEIHIGRIEVVAAPPAPPRPAVTPQRKSLSLDDYLSRRNGRSG